MMSWTAEDTKKYESFTRKLGVLPWANRTLIELTGKDRGKFLHNLCTADIKGLSPGKGSEAFLCNVQGKILAHLFVFCHDESLVLETVGGQAAALLPHLDKYLITEDVNIVDRTDGWEQWLLAGPEAPKFLADHGVDLSSVSLDHYLDHCTATNGWGISNVRHGGDPSYLIRCTPGAGKVLLAKCREADAIEGNGLIAEALRIENAVPNYGQDINEQRLPQEIDRNELAISFTKGCYLGQETVARIDALGRVNWHLVTVKLGGVNDPLPETNSELTVDGQVVGHITSASWSPRYQAPIAFALIRREKLESGALMKIGESTVTTIG